jgi:hypothetical protein
MAASPLGIQGDVRRWSVNNHMARAEVAAPRFREKLLVSSSVSRPILLNFLSHPSTGDASGKMAVSITSTSELTDEQVDAMLARAAQRLREKSKSAVAKSESFHIPKLDVRNLDIVPASSSASKFANVGLKKLDDPLPTTLSKQEVRRSRNAPNPFKTLQ